LSIFSAFKRHGNVNVHFVGMNASAATIASLGAKHITMDASAMYLVHKCSVGFFEWGQLNSDGLQALIDNIEHQKADLDKLDANIAQMYATRCKKEPSELLDLMKAGGWLTAQEALAWGFVDELTDYEDEEAPVLTDTMANAMSAAGIPIPNLPNMKFAQQEQSAFAKFMSMLTQYFTNSKKHEFINSQTSTSNPMKKIFTSICAILACEHLLSNEGKITLDDAQLNSIESAISRDKQTINDLNAQIETLKTEKQTLADAKAQLEAEKQAHQEESLNATQHYRAARHEIAAGQNLLAGMGNIGTSAESALRGGYFNLSEDLSALRYKYGAEAAGHRTEALNYKYNADVTKKNRRVGVLASGINVTGAAAKGVTGMYKAGVFK
jgi:enoyl-CoA hydratase/carnithine racemase